jgi:hypothetical protein
MRRNVREISAALAVSVLGFAASARADDAQLTAAREHFARGYALAESGNAEAAIGEFEQAYAASPKPSVLYNLGQAYAAAGRSSEAVDALERFLKLSGSSVDEARARQVEALIRYHAQRVGKLTIELSPPESLLYVDGRALGKGSRTLSLNAGSHSLTATAPGFEPVSVPVAIAPGESKPLALRLAALPAPAGLAIRCRLDGVTVSIDDAPRGKTPSFGGGALASGAHRVRFERPGYLPDEHSVELRPGETQTVSCEPRIDPRDARHGRVAVTHPAGTRVFLDDAPYTGAQVPPGPHRLRVAGPGYTPEVRQIVLEPRSEASFTLVPPRDPHAVADERERTRKTLRVGAYVLAGVGAATAVSAVALYVDDNARYASWQAQSRTSVRTLASDPNAPASLDALLAEENDIRRRDAWALGLTVFSCAALATSTVLFLSSREPEQRLVITAGSEPSLRYERSF